jgi:tetratricopeptide (TPR) repeat protein
MTSDRSTVLDPRRIRDLDRRAAKALRAAVEALAAKRHGEAAECVFAARVVAPTHPEPMLWQARIQRALGRVGEARKTIQQARAALPGDSLILLETAQLAILEGDLEAGEAALAEGLVAAAGQPTDLAALAELADAQGIHGVALTAAEQCLEGRPGDVKARLLMARSLTALGRIAEAAAAYRGVLRDDPAHAGAWWALADLKTVRLEDPEITTLARLVGAASGTSPNRALLGFALGQALEALGRYAEAYAALVNANAIIRDLEPWSPVQFRDRVAASREAFVPPPAGGDAQGSEVIFLVGLPRSGSTLIEQVLAGHPAIEGASELPSLEQVLTEESLRRRKNHPHWAREATAADWARLGERYLALTRRWRRRRPISTDKLPENWLHAGAIRAMLPGARIIDCRRDPVEIAWSCFRQRFAPGRVPWAQDFDGLALYLAEARRFGDRMAHLHPAHYRIQSLEALVESPEREARALFDFLGLAFDPQCLDTHRADRAVRTASAAQVREPMRMPTSRSAAYGALLDPLRQAISAAQPLD